jgi:hypothetical protein
VDIRWDLEGRTVTTGVPGRGERDATGVGWDATGVGWDATGVGWDATGVGWDATGVG